MNEFMLQASVATPASPPRRQGRLRFACALAPMLALVLGACGQKGPLLPAPAAGPAPSAGTASAPAR